MEIIIPAIVLILVLLLPNRHVFALLVIPVIVISDYLGLVKPILSVGDADVRLYDMVIIIAVVKTALLLIIKPRKFQHSPLIAPLSIFFGLLVIANIVAYLRIGEDVFIGETIALVRMSTQIATCILVSLSISKTEDLQAARLIDYVGVLIGITMYYNILFPASGFALGEVQITSQTTRYFGPVGDQVGFILVYFCIKSFIDRRWLASLFYVGAIWSTGTRGALFALAAAFFVILLMKSEFKIGKEQAISMCLAFLLFGATMLYFDVGGLWSRLFKTELQFGFVQRIATFILALRVFYENPIIGVGFTGFRYVALDYGAWELFNSIPDIYFIYNAIATTGNQYLQVLADGGITTFVVFIWLIARSLKVLRAASDVLSREFRHTMLAAYIWLIALLVGNQSATWLLPNSLISFLLFILLGFAVAATQLRLAEHTTALHPRRRFVQPSMARAADALDRRGVL